MPQNTSQDISNDAPGASDLSEVAGRAPLNEKDRIPSWLMRLQELLYGWLSADSRLTIAVVIIVIAIAGLLLLSSLRFLEVIIDGLDITAYLGLFLVNWIGNGGALVPIPGARLLGLLMIFQNAVLFPSWEVFAVSGAAMALGLLSYYIAGARTAQAYETGDTEGAVQLATETGMLVPSDDPTDGPAPATGEVRAAHHPTTDQADGHGRAHRLKRRMADSFKRAQDRAEPIIDKRGTQGVFLLCFAPSPLGTAAAFLGGVMRFGFSRYLAASFAAKYLLAGIVVLAGLAFGGTAPSVDLPF